MKKSLRKMLSTHLLFEIGTEEIPAGYLEAACENIRRKAPVLLEECGHRTDDLSVHATPRRLVIFGRNFSKLESKKEERLGPSKEQCYQDNQLTEALKGFLKNVGKRESDLAWKETARGVRACVWIEKEIKPLRYFFESLPAKIEFPKLMRWSVDRFTFSRPIRWTFALVGTKIQRFMIGSLPSGAVTYGHRFLANRQIRVLRADLDSYRKILRKHHVVLNLEERVSMIQAVLKKYRNEDRELVTQVANLVEEPSCVEGTFSKEYLSLPAEILSTCMKKHQKIFACYDQNGKLINRFVAVMNGKRPDAKAIAKNYENVLVSRLEDAKFFYHEDAKTKLETKLPKLKEMVFLGQLGTYFDKMERAKALVDHLGRNIAGASWFKGNSATSDEILRDALRAAELCKADLMTHLVYEFPELQGFAGSEYARKDGESKHVSEAICEHYYPLNLSQDYRDLVKKMNLPAVLVSLADRTDLLVGSLGIGIEPSGSRDPYALRRAAGGLVKIVRAFRFSFSLSLLIRKAAQLYGSHLKMSAAEIEKKLVSFVKERMIFELDLKTGSRPHEIFLAVFDAAFDDLANVYDRFGALLDLYQQNPDEFMKTCKVVERTSNILKGAKEVPNEINHHLFQAAEEKTLYHVFCEKEGKIHELLAEKKYNLASREYGKLFYEPVHQFFDKVLVNDEDQKVRANRQALVKKINRLYTEKIANLALVTNP